MEKNTFGKGIGIGGAVAVILGIICQLTHNGVPVMEEESSTKSNFKAEVKELFKEKHQDNLWVEKLKALVRKHFDV